ncbi:hypothetical protein BvCmsHHNP023_01524 [Escherichia coli]|nr:hypothetical protein BvCmsHHNP023_01524 [Escherichia coli]
MVVPYERNLHEVDKLPELKVRCERKADLRLWYANLWGSGQLY